MKNRPEDHSGARQKNHRGRPPLPPDRFLVPIPAEARHTPSHEQQRWKNDEARAQSYQQTEHRPNHPFFH